MEKDYQKWRDIAIKNGIGRRTFNSRVRKSGWTFERAATTEVLDRHITGGMVKNRKYPRYYIELAKLNGIPDSTFYIRMRKGWSLEMAATQKPAKKGYGIKKDEEV